MVIKTNMPEKAHFDFVAEEEFSEQFKHVMVAGVEEGTDASKLVQFTDIMREGGAECIIESSRNGDVIMLCGADEPIVKRGGWE